MLTLFAIAYIFVLFAMAYMFDVMIITVWGGDEDYNTKDACCCNA
ncbi:hypothetical protein SME10J_41020 [Serratia marcescens]|nr:hypothetical protein SME10J_41020 [Serratia marcescens]